MSNMKAKKRRKLSLELLLLTGVCVVICIVLFALLFACANALVDMYIASAEDQAAVEDFSVYIGWVINICLGISAAVFVILFLVVIGERLSYIAKIIKGIEMLKEKDPDFVIPLEGNNELTSLAEEINILSEKRRQIEKREKALYLEKEQFIRTMSHDIRTPLTSIIGYSELLSRKDDLTAEEAGQYIGEIRKKSYVIKEMTDVLLDDGKRNIEYFENARLLFEQLAEEFEESVSDFELDFDWDALAEFSGSFDVLELRRIFDNLASNVNKYADDNCPVYLKIEYNGELTVIQKNKKKADIQKAESYKMGIASIRRIAGNYNGRVATDDSDEDFEIRITLLDF